MEQKSLIKIITIVSVLTGAIAGMISIIPFLSFIIMIIVMFFMAPFILLYLKHLKLIKDSELEKSVIYGAISGFTGFIGYSLTFFPIAFIIDCIFKTQTFFWVKIVCQNFFYITTIIFFTSLLCAMFNAFSGFLTSYTIQYINKR